MLCTLCTVRMRLFPEQEAPQLPLQTHPRMRRPRGWRAPGRGAILMLGALPREEGSSVCHGLKRGLSCGLLSPAQHAEHARLNAKIAVSMPARRLTPCSPAPSFGLSGRQACSLNCAAGLDSEASERLAASLARLAKRGTTVVMSVHQASRCVCPAGSSPCLPSVVFPWSAVLLLHASTLKQKSGGEKERCAPRGRLKWRPAAPACCACRA